MVPRGGIEPPARGFSAVWDGFDIVGRFLSFPLRFRVLDSNRCSRFLGITPQSHVLFATQVLPRDSVGEMRTRLTKSIVDKAEPRSSRYTIWDTEVVGFGLKVQPTGKKVYFVYYRSANGQQRRPAIGLHGKLTEEEARQAAKKWIASALTGEDVSGNRKEARNSPTVSELADRYLNEYALPHKKPWTISPRRHNLNKPASGNPGAVHFAMRRSSSG